MAAAQLLALIALIIGVAVAAELIGDRFGVPNFVFFVFAGIVVGPLGLQILHHDLFGKKLGAYFRQVWPWCRIHPRRERRGFLLARPYLHRRRWSTPPFTVIHDVSPNGIMVHSTWDDWFVSDEVEAAAPDGLSVWYLGGNGFVLRTAETTAYLDPYFGTGNPPRIVRAIPVPMDPADATRCDAVFVTHEHIDHMHPPSYGPLVTDLGATLYAPRAAYEQPAYDGDLRAPDDRRRVVEPGDQFEVGDLVVHVRGAHDPDAVEPVSYVMEHESGSFFHPGDSRPADAFEAVSTEFDLDLGVVPFGTVGKIYHSEDEPPEAYPTDWYNDGNQVVEIATQLQLDRLLPSHWDLWKGVRADPTALFTHADSFAYPRTIEIAEIGDRIDLERPGVVPTRALRGH